MIKKLLLNDKFILILILFNAIIIFVSGFELNKPCDYILILTDNLITSLFILELFLKTHKQGFMGYLSSNWNKLDFILIIISIPALVSFLLNLDSSNISFILVFRLMRIFKSLRFLKFIPEMEKTIRGIQRALKASLIVLIGFLIYIFIVGVFSFYLFKSSSPDYFNNPLSSVYTIFKIFTMEG